MTTENIKNTEKENQDFIFGRKVILTAIENQVTVNRVYIAKGSKGSIVDELTTACRKNKIIFSFLEKKEMDRKFGENTQGVVAYVSANKYYDLDEILEKMTSCGAQMSSSLRSSDSEHRSGDPRSLHTKQNSGFPVSTTENDTNPIQQNSTNIASNASLCILDGITDPHNTGAIIRNAYAFGLNGILIPDRNSCLVNSTVVKASAGAANLLPIVKIGNIVNAINKLKEKNFWIVGVDMEGESLEKTDFSGRNICFVLGSEGDGIKRLVKENCDFCVKIPLVNNFDSLNVSCASAIVFHKLAFNK